MATINSEASVKRHQKRLGFGAGSPSPFGGSFFGAQPEFSGSLIESVRDRPQEGLEPLSVGLERGARAPLGRSVVAGADRAELDRRHPHPQEGDGVGGSVAPDAHRLAV